MKLSRFIGFVFLVLPSLASGQTLNVGASGIDWEKSKLEIKRFNASHKSHEAAFICFKKTYADLPISQSLSDLGFNNTDVGPLTLNQKLLDSACFQQAGVYDLGISLVDKAGNVSELETDFTVVPTDLDLSASRVLPVASQTSGGKNFIADISDRINCTSRALIADGQDTCSLEVRLQDRFKNVISPEGVSGKITLALPKTNTERLDATQGLYDAFLNGLYFENDKKTVDFLLPNKSDRLLVGLKAYVPSLTQSKEEDASSASVTEVSPQKVKVDLNFLAETDEKALLESKIVEPQFSPWVQVRAQPKDSLENYLLLPLNRAVNVPFKISNEAQKPLPKRLGLDWKAPKTMSLWLRFWESEGERLENLRQIITAGTASVSSVLGMQLLQPEGVVGSDEDFLLSPIISYPQSTPAGNKVVRYPLSLLGAKGTELLAPFAPLKLQMSVEGRLLTQEGSESSAGMVLSEVDRLLFTSWREQLTRQALALTRGQTPRNETTFNLSRDFGEDSVAYFKGVTVRLTSDDEGNKPMQFNQGAKTIIIEDGNLLLTRDLEYATVEDSLGVMLINSSPTDTKHGHLFVHQNVQSVAGSYFLDGALVSTQNLLEPSITDLIEQREETNNQNSDSALALQLVLQGSLFSRNTVGGADKNPSEGPNGQSLRRELALIYDLNYLRRYEPLFNSNGERLPDDQNDYCAKLTGTECYPNPAPLVIVYDGRAQKLPPPGFKD